MQEWSVWFFLRLIWDYIFKARPTQIKHEKEYRWFKYTSREHSTHYENVGGEYPHEIRFWIPADGYMCQYVDDIKQWLVDQGYEHNKGYILSGTSQQVRAEICLQVADKDLAMLAKLVFAR